jgi:hypothetical protein
MFGMLVYILGYFDCPSGLLLRDTDLHAGKNDTKTPGSNTVHCPLRNFTQDKLGRIAIDATMECTCSTIKLQILQESKLLSVGARQ